MLQYQHLLLCIHTLVLRIKKTTVGKIKSLTHSQRNFFSLQIKIHQKFTASPSIKTLLYFARTSPRIYIN